MMREWVQTAGKWSWETISQIHLALRHLRQQRRIGGLAVLTGGGYLVVYLVAIGELRTGAEGIGIRIADAPVSTLFSRTYGPTAFEPVAIVQAEVLTYVVSLNTGLGLGIAGLFGAAVGVSVLTWRQPTACRSPTAGIIAGLPALLSGTACCGPLVAIALGIQITGGLLFVFDLLLPVGVGGLIAGLAVASRQLALR